MICKKKTTLRSLAFLTLIGLCVTPFLSGCQIGYVLSQARHQASLLASREKITDVLEDPTTSPAEREKLELTQKIRTAAPEMGFEPKKLYSQYARIDSPALTWVLMATAANSLELKTWWFPVVGTVPYKGFFNQKDAEKEAAALTAQGYETSVRGSIAFSSLGWFNDPVVSTMIPMNDWDFSATLFHELTHATVWIPGQVPFNETLAETVGIYAAGTFLKDEAGTEKRIQFSRDLENATSILKNKLVVLYSSEKDPKVLAETRKQIWEESLAPIHKKYEGFHGLVAPNNPELLQLTTYLTGFGRIASAVNVLRSNWSGMWKLLKYVAADCKRAAQCSPIDLLEKGLLPVQAEPATSH